MAPLPINQQPPQPQPRPTFYNALTTPAQGTPIPIFPGPLGHAFAASAAFDPFTEAQSNLLSQRRDALDTWFSNTFRGPTSSPFNRDLQNFGGALASIPVGLQALNLDLQKGVVDAGRGIKDYFSGANYTDPRFQQSQPLPVTEELPPGMPTNPNAPVGTDIANMGFLDGTTVVPGAGLMPKPPTLELPENFNPDYAKADARLDAGRPKGVKPKGTESQAGWLGVAEAAGRIDPYETNWAQALAQVSAGWQRGKENFRLRQEEAEIRAEAENRQYELMRAGVEEQRATHEAQMHYNQTKLELDLLQTKWDQDFKTWQMNQPNVRVGNNGETVIQRRDAQGNLVIERSGFREALQFEIARERAKAMGGKRGEYQLISQAAESGNAIAVVDGLTTRYIGEGLEHSLLTPTSAAVYEEKKRQIDEELLLQRLPKETFETIRTQKLLGALKEVIETGGVKAEAYRRQMLGLGNPLAGNSLSPEQPKAKQSFTSGGYLPQDEPPPNPFSSILGQQPDGAY